MFQRSIASRRGSRRPSVEQRQRAFVMQRGAWRGITSTIRSGPSSIIGLRPCPSHSPRHVDFGLPRGQTGVVGPSPASSAMSIAWPCAATFSQVISWAERSRKSVAFPCGQSQKGHHQTWTARWLSTQWTLTTWAWARMRETLPSASPPRSSHASSGSAAGSGRAHCTWSCTASRSPLMQRWCAGLPACALGRCRGRTCLTTCLPRSSTAWPDRVLRMVTPSTTATP
mmetsp:Transcript_101092/g.294351  ORF Transcript_101092/g.294351 Transcript_101092/m.294351 type:complete len:227 (-) Transcript_101092:438-1118(-)